MPKDSKCYWNNNEINPENRMCTALIKNAPVGIVIANCSGIITFVNSKAEELFGYTRVELIGTSVHNLVPDDLYEKHVNDCNNFFTSPSHRDMGTGLELSAKKRDGTLFPVEIALSNVTIDKEEMAICFIVDISKRKSAEKELEQSREEFLAILTHDLKSPLASIMSFTELMVEPEENLNQDMLEYIMIIRHSGEVMLDLINNLVGVSRLDSGAMVYNFENILLDDLLNELEKTFKAIAAQGKITLDFSCKKNTWVRADYEKMRQVFHNLLSNAMRHVPDGATIGIKANPKHDKIEIKLWDTGYGIRKEEQKQLFQKFKQAKGIKKGTGLGLYIVKKILEGHNSKITLESEVDKGTTFFFSLEKIKQR